MVKSLLELIKNFSFLNLTGKKDTLVRYLTYDSNRVSRDSLFFACKGLHHDGHSFISQAIHKGASVIVHTEDISEINSFVTYLKVHDIKEAMSFLSHEFYDKPSHKLKVIGVTGTDGKSSSVFYLYQLLKSLNKKVGFISTVAYDIGEGLQQNPYHQSTPESTEIQFLLSQMVDAALEFAIIEATSHGLSLKNKRLENICFQAALLTNISEEHLDFHGSLESYVGDKLRLFQKADFGIVNHSCDFLSKFVSQKARCLTYSIKDNRSDYFVESIIDNLAGQKFSLNHGEIKHDFFIPLLGEFNIENVVGVVSLLNWAYKIPLDSLVKSCSLLKGASGRLELIDSGQKFPVIVDFAHTPGSFSRLLPYFQQRTKGKLIVIFGCAGERYERNRPIMGTIASQWADIIILSDDEPRGEDPKEILRQISSGITNKTLGIDLFLINDRKEAINYGISQAKENDCVLILGKGHETSLIYKDKVIAWSDQKVALEILKNRFISK